MDDILIFSTSLQEHIDSSHKIFNVLRNHNLKIQLDKCNFCCKQTHFLGHALRPQGVKVNPEKIKSIAKLKLPQTQNQIEAFLGVTGYYRKFVKNYAIDLIFEKRYEN